MSVLRPHVCGRSGARAAVRKDMVFGSSDDCVEFDTGSDAAEKVRTYFTGYSCVEERDCCSTYFAAERGRFALIGAYLTHLGAIALVIAAIVWFVTGYSGTVSVREGDVGNRVMLQDKATRKLPFTLRLDDFDVKYYKDSVKPKMITSDITIISSDKQQIKKTLLVNQPAKYKSYKICQKANGFDANPDVVFRMRAGIGKKLVNVPAKFGKKFSIPGTGLNAEILDFAPSLGQDGHGKLVNYNTMMMNPAVLVNFYDYDNSPLGSKWIFKNFPESGDMKSLKVLFDDAYGVQYSVMTVRYFPGSFLIYIGFLLIGIGVMVTLCLRHEQMWVRISDNGDETFRVSAKADRSSFRSGISGMLEKFKNTVSR